MSTVDERNEKVRPEPAIRFEGLDRLPLSVLLKDVAPHEDDRRAAIAKAVEGEIIPRLLIANMNRAAAREFAGEPLPADAAVVGRHVTDAEIARFSRDVIDRDVDEALAYVAELRGQGVELCTLFSELLGGAARQLGEEWERDERSFFDVTLGLCRIEEVLRALGPAFEQEAEPASTDIRVLLAAAPGEQHSLGVLVVEEFMRRAGFDVTSLPGADEPTILQAVRDDWFDVIGCSAATEGGFGRLPRLVRRVRHESCNKGLYVLVGGHVFSSRPDRVREVGADASADDAYAAVEAIRDRFGLTDGRIGRHLRTGGADRGQRVDRLR